MMANAAVIDADAPWGVEIGDDSPAAGAAPLLRLAPMPVQTGKIGAGVVSNSRFAPEAHGAVGPHLGAVGTSRTPRRGEGVSTGCLGDVSDVVMTP